MQKYPKAGKRFINMLPWLLGCLVTLVALVVWSAGLRQTDLTLYSFFPLFGLLAWSLMWTHYIYGAVLVRYKLPRNQGYKKITELIVLACLLLHPGLLAYQLWLNTGLLPPASTISYLANVSVLIVIASYVAWLVFLSYDVLVRLKNRPFWRKNWFWVSLSQAGAMLVIYLHAIALGRHIQVRWFKAYWAVLGLFLVPALVYLLWNDLPKEYKKIGVKLMKNSKIIITLILVVLALAGAMFIARNKETTSKTEVKNTTSNTTNSTSTVTLAQVQANDGKNGNACWVVVDKTVYEISGFAQWVDGVHTSSGGQARCGKDETNVIGESPHGRSVLRLLKVVGQYQS